MEGIPLFKLIGQVVQGQCIQESLQKLPGVFLPRYEHKNHSLARMLLPEFLDCSERSKSRSTSARVNKWQGWFSHSTVTEIELTLRGIFASIPEEYQRTGLVTYGETNILIQWCPGIGVCTVLAIAFGVTLPLASLSGHCNVGVGHCIQT